MDTSLDDSSLMLFNTRERLVEIDLEKQDDMDDNSSTCDPDGIQDEKEEVAIAASETKQVLFLRGTLTLVLVVVATFVSSAVYISSKKSEQKEFEAYAREACEKVASNFQSSAARRLSAIASLAKSISSNAEAQGLTWPNVTVPDFEERVDLTLDLAEVMSIILLPLVTGEDLEGWEDYSVANQGWFNESLAYQRSLGTNHSEWQDDVELLEAAVGGDSSNSIPGEVYQLGSNTSATAEDGPFMPWWQFAPAFPMPSLVNFDALSHPSRQFQLRAILENKEALVSEAWDYSDDENPATFGKKIVLNLFLRQWQKGGKRYQDGPVSDLSYPVMNGTEVAAVLTAYVYWQVYFENVLPHNTEPVVAVLENICGNQDNHIHDGHEHNHDHVHQQQFSYVIKGEAAVYIGQGDLHEASFDYLGQSTDPNAFLAATDDDLLEGQCIYRVRVYPTQEMKDNLSTRQPLFFMLTILATFAATSLIFVVYDFYVEQRQQVVLNKAIKSTEVVHTLFPENVRSRLFQENISGNRGSSPPTARLSTTTTDNHSSMETIATDSDHLARSNGPMVADLYKDCTVLFADLAGFTKWSSGREPTDIFQLLETLYGAFDRIAKKRRVFKVETIGDCYLAITGVPCAQKDHAVIMAKFAWDCIQKMDHLIYTKLVDQLGEDTADLKLRVGIHSGEVTAGVLRSDRARFQLFGDTVNTASRMESLSLPGKIQVSSETANLLREAMKGRWLVPREGGVEAKGKGTLETFWVQPSSKRSAKSRLAWSVSTGGLSGDSKMSESA